MPPGQPATTTPCSTSSRRWWPGPSASTAPSRSRSPASRCSAASGSPSSTTPTSTCGVLWGCAACSAPPVGTPQPWPTSPRPTPDAWSAWTLPTPRRASGPRSGNGCSGSPTCPTEDRRAALAESGYLTPHWPEPHGLGADPVQQLVIDEELARAGVSRPDLKIGAWAAPTIIDHGTEEQRKRFVGPTLTGEIQWCQLFSEPGAGSDLASLSSRAERVPASDRVRAGGSPARRSGPRLPARPTGGSAWRGRTATSKQHAGITYFLVDMASRGHRHPAVARAHR